MGCLQFLTITMLYLFTPLFLSSPSLAAEKESGISEEKTEEKIDDWLFEQKEPDSSHGMGLPVNNMRSYGAAMAAKRVGRAVPMAAAVPQMMKLGFAVGGAKDTNNFRQNIENNFLPKYQSITYEGLFYQYYFDTGNDQGKCQALFCPSYSKAVVPDLFSGQLDYYLSVGLNSGLTEESFTRKKLNLVVILDISGSMGAKFNEYYYDRAKNSPQQENDYGKSKMQLANETIIAMMQHLTVDDRFGVVLFDDKAYLAKPLRLVKHTNMQAISNHIKEIKDQGGTNWEEGYAKGIALYNSLQKSLKDSRQYENRIIFLTDAMPNLGEIHKDGLASMVRKAAKEGIYTSFIGVGIDFNPELVEYITKTKGANYFSVHNAKEFKKTVADEFDFMVTPLVFDLELDIKSAGYTIDGVFGSPEADLATGTVMTVNTLFPSPTENEQVKGGVILVKLKRDNKAAENAPIKLSLRYRNREGSPFTVTDEVVFTANDQGYENNGIRKAILLTEYVSLIKNWLLDQNKGCNDQVDIPSISFYQYGLHNPEARQERQSISLWEKKSCPFSVSNGYKKLFSLLGRHFRQEARSIDDQQLQKEIKILDVLTKGKQEETEKTPSTPVDDWQLQGTAPPPALPDKK